VPTRYSNAKVWLGAGLGFAHSLTVQGGQVVSNDLECDEVIDCGGAVIVPAFVDGHAHPVLAGREHSGPAITTARSIREIQQAVASWMQANPGDDWVIGGAYDRSILPDGKFLAVWLDEVAPDRPVVLHGDDHHTIWVNTEAMRRAGVNERAPEVSDGVVDVDSDGRPTGVFRETDAKDLIFNHQPKPSLAQEFAALEWSHDEMLRLGITAVQDAWVDYDLAQVYLKAAEQAKLKIHTNLGFWWQPNNWQTRLTESVDARAEAARVGNPLLQARTVKFFLDGVFGSATASVSQAYETTGEFGNPVWTRENLLSATLAASQAGFQLHLHAIGDAASTLALDAVEYCQAQAGELPFPAVMAHLELVHDKDIERFAALGVVANFQPLWGRPDGMLNSCRPHLGPRVEELYRIRDVVDAGAKISFGSDWPVSDPNPLLGAFTAVKRQVPGADASHNIKQAISFEQALDAYTAASAAQIGLSDRGSLLPGNAADFVVLSADPFEDVTLLPSINVVKTISGGQTLFTRH
jgi:predicted amidohydrolase YtcJ